MMAYILSDMGSVARALGDYPQAKQHYQASYAIKNEFNDPEGMAAALNHLGKIAVLQKEFSEADRLYQQGLEIYHEINDRGGLATSLSGLGVVACALEDYQAAYRYYNDALQITTNMKFIPLTLSILVGICELIRQRGQVGRAVELLAMVQGHPATDGETRNRVQHGLDRFRAELSAAEFGQATQRGASSSLDSMMATVQRELSAPGESLKEAGALTRPDSQPDAAAQPTEIVESLTPRELEVLRLLADGLSNREMAEELVISVGTVKWYTGQIYGKLGGHPTLTQPLRSKPNPQSYNSVDYSWSALTYTGPINQVSQP
jgi:ATP/maltotriose-dependent transcriptional regulator MalT